ncbi:MAG: beta-lactamase family protein [Oscillospiraceae bacterium]|jgi:CubicO group peptidase (beta-lactamase class C family)|nr:beta-lactamase family protein [Oscillospiraceae bacterium]
MQTTEKAQTLPRAQTPEEAGVSSQAILDLLDEFDRREFEHHGLMILRHGKVVFEQYRAPYAAEIPHSIYSFSKSIAATAAGFAADEGLFSLDDKIGQYFPEYRPKKKARYWDQVTLRHVITMTSGLAFDVFHQNSAPDWIGDYLHSHLRDEPGTIFHYTNECAYLISVLIRRLTGQTMWEYLTPRLFEPLGMETPFTETDQQGNPGGGWGVIWKLEDSAKFIQCYLDGGRWRGKQVIPAWWVAEATRKQSDNSGNVKADSNRGYGYQFWMCQQENAFAARGMFCQQGFCMRDYDAVFVYFGADADEQKPFDAIYPHFPGGFFEEKREADPAALQELRRREASLAFPPPPVSNRMPELEEKLNGSMIRLRKQRLLNIAGYPQGLLPMTVNQMCVDRAGNMTDIALEFGENEARFSWREGHWRNSIPLGMDGRYRVGKVTLAGFHFDAYAYAEWKSGNTLYLNIRPIQTCVSNSFLIRFRGRRVKITPRSTPTFQSIAANLCKLSFAYLNNNPLMCLVSRFVFAAAPYLMEGNFYGRLKNRRIKRRR